MSIVIETQSDVLTVQRRDPTVYRTLVTAVREQVGRGVGTFEARIHVQEIRIERLLPSLVGDGHCGVYDPMW